jgi:hypothetical protein
MFLSLLLLIRDAAETYPAIEEVQTCLSYRPCVTARCYRFEPRLFLPWSAEVDASANRHIYSSSSCSSYKPLCPCEDKHNKLNIVCKGSQAAPYAKRVLLRMFVDKQLFTSPFLTFCRNITKQDVMSTSWALDKWGKRQLVLSTNLVFWECFLNRRIRWWPGTVSRFAEVPVARQTQRQRRLRTSTSVSRYAYAAKSGSTPRKSPILEMRKVRGRFQSGHSWT